MMLILLVAEALGPDHWASSALLGAVIAALGFIGKQVVDLVLGLMRERRLQRAKLVQLHSLLRASRITFRSQRSLAQRLVNSLRSRRPDTPTGEGLEWVFSRYQADLTPDERELHGVIRAMTEHSMRPLNLAMTDWLAADTTFKVEHDNKGGRTELALKLADLEAHLALWHAKYQAWIPGHEYHALVYLADEQDQGIGFPVGIDALVEKVLFGRAGTAESKNVQDGIRDVQEHHAPLETASQEPQKRR